MERIKEGWLDFADFLGKPMLIFMSVLLAGFIFSLSMSIYTSANEEKTYYVCKIADNGTPTNCQVISKEQYKEQ